MTESQKYSGDLGEHTESDKDLHPNTEELISAGAVAIVNEKGQVFLMKRPEYDSDFGGDWVFPGGTSQPNEIGDPLTTAIRETTEEAGVTLDPVKHRIFPIANYVTAPDFWKQQHDLSIYIARYSSDSPQPYVADSNEAVDAAWFYPEEIFQRVINGEMKVLPSGLYAINRTKEYLSDDKKLDYAEVLMGGTFDRLHTGHKHLLESAFQKGDYVYIGLTTDQYIERSQKVLKEIISSFAQRQKGLRTFLAELGVLERTIILPLSDVAGPKAMDPKLGAIVLSEETTGGGNIINERRQNVGVAPMDVIVVSLIRDTSGGVISSTSIRQKEQNG